MGTNRRVKGVAFRKTELLKTEPFRAEPLSESHIGQIPLDDTAPIEENQNARWCKKTPKRNRGPPTHAEYQDQDDAQGRACQRRKKYDGKDCFPAEKCADHGHEFHVSSSHSFHSRRLDVKVTRECQTSSSNDDSENTREKAHVESSVSGPGKGGRFQARKHTSHQSDHHEGNADSVGYYSELPVDERYYHKRARKGIVEEKLE